MQQADTPVNCRNNIDMNESRGTYHKNHFWSKQSIIESKEGPNFTLQYHETDP
jgi:hypothetical protein